MARPLGWLRSPRSLPLLLGLVVAVPAVTLVVLGLRLFDQDRALARTRRTEQLESAADRAVRAIDQELGELTRRLSDPRWRAETRGPGSVSVVMTDTEVKVVPASGIAWYPNIPPLEEPSAGAFVGLDAAEFRLGDLSKALDISRRLAAQHATPIRAGALLREAAVLRKMHRSADATEVYTELAEIRTVAVDGEPVDLVARRAMCELAGEDGHASDQRAAALSLQADLGAGRWTLDRPTYEYVASKLDQWLLPDRNRDGGREAIAAGVEWLWRQKASSGGLAATGSHNLSTDGGGDVTLVWVAAPARVAAVVALPGYVGRNWHTIAALAAAPATITIEPRWDGHRGTLSGGQDAVVRTTVETGLPWAVVASFPPGTAPDDLPGRQRTLAVALVAVLTLAGAGAFVVFRMRRQEIALLRLQSDFVSAVSHEFRTPLTVLRQFNDLLASEADVTLDKRREYLRGQTRATERLHRLVESVLDFGRMEAGRRPYTFQHVDAGALVRDVVDEFRAELDGRCFDLRCGIEATDHPILADPEAPGRAIWNLLDNAVKYSGDSRQLEISVGDPGDGLRGSHGEIAISVRDHGIGVPPDEQERIFQTFVRGAAAVAARIKGTGIGLAMAHHIVAAHRGEITVASGSGDGSMFTIRIPRA